MPEPAVNSAPFIAQAIEESSLKEFVSDAASDSTQAAKEVVKIDQNSSGSTLTTQLLVSLKNLEQFHKNITGHEHYSDYRVSASENKGAEVKIYE